MKTLEDLKAENVRNEEEAAQITETEQAEPELNAINTETEEPIEAAEQQEEGAEGVETEAWQITDEQTSDNGEGKQFDGSDIAAAKRNLRGKLERKHESATADLKAEIEALRQQVTGGNIPEKQPAQQPQQQQVQAMPTMATCEYDEEAYQTQMAQWMQGQMQANMQAMHQTQARETNHQAASQKLNASVDQHYERAAKLANEAGITTEVYQAADMSVRRAIEDVVPDRGDLITDELIARLGEGSEKVIYFLGRNASEQMKLKNLLTEDPSGLSASMYLGELKGKVSAPSKRTVSNAPKPAAQLSGDGAGNGNDAAKHKRDYDKAKSPQEKFDIRRKAKKAGVDTSIFNS